jgi:hypothetical protein
MLAENLLRQGLYFAPKLANHRMYETFSWPETLFMSLTVSATEASFHLYGSSLKAPKKLSIDGD